MVRGQLKGTFEVRGNSGFAVRERNGARIRASRMIRSLWATVTRRDRERQWVVSVRSFTSEKLGSDVVRLKRGDEHGGAKVPFECIGRMTTARGGGANRPTTRGHIRRSRKLSVDWRCSEALRFATRTRVRNRGVRGSRRKGGRELVARELKDSQGAQLKME